MGVKKTGDLVIAAAAQLTFVQQKDKFTRDDIAAEMKAAPIFFKQNMIGNLTATLNTLTKADRLNQSGKDVYALSSSERTSLEPKLAQSS